MGASWAVRLKSETLYRVIAVLLVLIATVLVLGRGAGGEAILTGAAQAIVGVIAGFAIGVVASLIGVAGGELLIPTLILLFGADIKLAGSLSLAVSLPTMIVGFARYSQDRSFAVHRQQLVLRFWSWQRVQSRDRSSAAGCSGLFLAPRCCQFSRSSC